MTSIVWIVAVAVIGSWSALTWGTWWLLSGATDVATASLDWFAFHPDLDGWIEWTAGILEQFGSVLLWIIWGAGTIALVALAWVVARFTRAAA